ncbi:MAG TPA: FHA domain-containing protein [Actinomycetota bacterium]|nr:FHA domain-containing protein [Actinomycetota bacterium]
MPDLVLLILKYVFLAILWIFVARAVRAVLIELRPAKAAAPGPRSRAPVPAQPPPRRAKTKKAPGRAVVVEGTSLKGQAFPLTGELTIGRSDQCNVKIEGDTYVSSVHARIYARDGSYMVEDLGSTNGTYLNRRRITAPAELQRGDRVKVGKTVLEMRK